MSQPTIRIGTMGFSYADWSGPFYPAELKAGEYLEFYSRYFDAVELDTTWHATPPPDRVRHWAAITPADFRFCAKAPRAVTHESDTNATEELARFLDVIRELGPKLTAVLIQYPPTFTTDEFARLETLLRTLPDDVRFAVELRHRSWGNRRTVDLLHAHRCCLVSAEYAMRPARIVVTTDFLYIRLIGEHGQYPTHEKEIGDKSLSMQWWCGELSRQMPKVKQVCGFINNDYTGYSIAAAKRLKQMLGLTAALPTAEDRGELF